MPHNQIIMSKMANILNLAPALRLANQTDKLVLYRLILRLEATRGCIALT